MLPFADRSLLNIVESPHDKTIKMACAPSENSDQPQHLPSLIRFFAVHMKKPWALSYSLSAQRRLVRLGGCPGWSESSLGAHAILLVLSWDGSQLIHDRPRQRDSIMHHTKVRCWSKSSVPTSSISFSSFGSWNLNRRMTKPNKNHMCAIAMTQIRPSLISFRSAFYW